jgi:hypothetical protein
MSQISTIDDIDINTTSPVQAWPKATFVGARYQ